MRPVDMNQVLEKVTVWECELKKSTMPRQIEIPKYVVVETPAQPMREIPQTYIHTNIVYPDENEYSCDEDDIVQGLDATMMQQLDIRRNLNQTRNYCRQYELLNSIEYCDEAYKQKVEKLNRPLLRVFMRAQENDYRMNVAFRPSRAYKQKRFKRLNLPEFDVARQIIQTENQIALHLLSQIKQRELLKLKLIKSDEAEFKSTFNNCQDLFSQLKDLRSSLKEEDPIDIKEKGIKIFDTCNDPECQYQFQQTHLSSQLIDFIEEQYMSVKDKAILWPRIPTQLSNWNIDHYTKIGIHQNNKQLVYTANDRTLFIMDRTKKNKKKVKLMLVDRNRASVFDGVRANFDHFYTHYQKTSQKIEQSIDHTRKELYKQRQEQAKKEQMLRNQQKREELKKSLKITLRISDFLEPKIVKMVKIKWSEDLKFILRRESTHIKHSQIIVAK